MNLITHPDNAGGIHSSSGQDERPCSPDTSDRYLIRASELLRERRISDLLLMGGLTVHKSGMVWKALVELQATIFALDHYGETCWEVRPDVLSRLWKSIRNKVGPFLKTESVREGLAEIQRYQQIELNIRNGVDVNSVEIGDFYSAKCCDVKLARRIALSMIGDSSREEIMPKPWLLFDLVSEVADDLDDIEEDMSTFNGNRLVASCRNDGVDETVKQYSAFLVQCRDEVEIFTQHLSDDPLERQAIIFAQEQISRLQRYVASVSLEKRLVRVIQNRH